MALDDLHSTLLLNGEQRRQHPKSSFLFSLGKWVLQSAMWIIFIAWIVLCYYIRPTGLGSDLYGDWIHLTTYTMYAELGSILLLYSGPIIAIALLAVPYLIFFREDELEYQERKEKKPKFSLWTFPLLVDGPLGLVTAAEMIGIILFIFFVIWALYFLALECLAELFDTYGRDIDVRQKICLFLELYGLRLGLTGLFCISFLFLPVARGSVLLRLINIPYEIAIKYHVWLGHLTMLIFTCHGLLYVTTWSVEGRLIEQILLWQDVGINNPPGVVALIAGLLMWATSFAVVRRLNFELFLYTHYLYIIFIVAMAMHIGGPHFGVCSGGVFLFLMDRFLRFCQSRRVVDIISAKSRPCGTVELVLAKPANMRYSALSFVFLQVRELSWLQWHPFSVSSSPLDGKYHISVLIGGLGSWTEKLKGNMSKISEEVPGSLPTKITASVEGPYGHEIPYYMMYENLILVAGGVGIAPFLAVLSDIFHSVRQGKPCLPRNILVVWAVKTSNEISLLSSIDMISSLSDKLNLQVHIYVTRESESPLEEGRVESTVGSSFCPMSKGCGMSVLVGTGHNLWSGLYLISSTVGFVVLLSLLDYFYMYRYNVFTWWSKGLSLLACMVAGIVIFGGPVIALWHLWDTRISANDQGEDDKINSVEVDHSDENTLANLASIRYGRRPDFREIFETVSKDWGHVDVGVIVCGPPSLQSSVAKEIRRCGLRRQSSDPIFHFNSHSFEL